MFFRVILMQSGYVTETSEVLKVSHTTTVDEALSYAALDILSTSGMNASPTMAAPLPEIAEDNAASFEDAAMQMFSL